MSQHIKNLLAVFLPQQQPQSNNWQHYLLQEWNTIIGDLQTHIKLEKIQGDTLVLSVEHATWMQELYMLSPMLIAKINAKLDKPHIKQVRFKYGQGAVCPKQYGQEKKVLKPVKAFTLTNAQKKALAAIEDPGLAQALRNFLERCHNEREL